MNDGARYDPSLGTRTTRPPIFGFIRVAAVGILCLASIAWCVATWNHAGRLMFLPMGDVGLGFCSHAGWMQWIEYAPWEKTPDHLQWEVPWAAVILVESLIAARFIWTLRRRVNGQT